MDARVSIWATPGAPLRQRDWESNGFKSLADYIIRQEEGHDGHTKKACSVCQKYEHLPLVSFGMFYPSTGQKDIILVADTEEEIPNETLAHYNGEVFWPIVEFTVPTVSIPDKPLEELTLRDLKILAKQKGIVLQPNMKKAQIIDLLKDA